MPIPKRIYLFYWKLRGFVVEQVDNGTDTDADADVDTDTGTDTDAEK